MYFPNFPDAIEHAQWLLLEQGDEVDAGRWQGYPTGGRPDLITKEILNLQLEVPVPNNVLSLEAEIFPNLPWASDHFAERVSRVPSNPGEEYKNWPWWQGQQHARICRSCGEPEGPKHLDTCPGYFNDPIFSHTYQERFWPKMANGGRAPQPAGAHRGIRYKYGDLDDVVNLLIKEPYTRQSTFPIFFPEDTGVVHGGRVPCTLHYHFLLRQNKLHLWYPIRSCDLVRHFRDDLYMACRLLLWVLDELKSRKEPTEWAKVWADVEPGNLYFTAYSFHVHKGDLHHVQG